MSHLGESSGWLKWSARVSGAVFTQRLASAFLVIIVTSFLLVAGAFEPFENRLTALRAQMLDRSPSGQFAIVEIDARSLSELSTWPWSRRYHAEAVKRLHSANAELIAFDVDFSALSEPSGDEAFAAALREAEPVILPIFQQSSSDQSGQKSIIRSEPAPIFDAAWVGGVNIFPAADGVVREYPAATIMGHEIRPSIAALLAESDDLKDRTFQPDWAIDAGRIPRFSFVDVVKGRVPRDAIAGKRIVIGATAIELGDRYIVPRHGNIPGVVIQALAAESLLQGRALSRSGSTVTLLGIVLIGLTLGAGRFRRFNWMFPLAALAMMGLLAVAPFAIQARWPYSLDSAAMLFAASGCVAMRALFEVRRRVALKALIDSETNLANRAALEADLAKGGDAATVMAVAAIDRFETIRDAIGSEAVVDLILDASERVAMRSAGPVYRIAPDIIAWLQPAESARDEHNGMAKDIRALFRDPVQTRQGDVDVQLTIGLDRSPVAEGIVLKIERALAAVNTARATGDRCHWYQGADPIVRRQLSMMGDLRRGMAAGEVTVAYQPKLDLRTGRITHAEALVRWHHPVDGFMPPDLFIPLAEATGVISELTDFVLRTVIADSARLNAMGRSICLAVNVSAAEIASRAFVEQVKNILVEFDGEPSSLALEVTESAIIRSTATAITVLTALRELGIRLSIDDYGTGQSTLSYLKQLPVHELKIDKSFVTGICHSSGDEIMVRSTIGMAHDLGLQVVAEGVEDEAAARLLRSLGCDYIQGYLVGKAVPLKGLWEITMDQDFSTKVA